MNITRFLKGKEMSVWEKSWKEKKKVRVELGRQNSVKSIEYWAMIIFQKLCYR